MLEDKLKLLPENSGVYIMYDKDGTVIYVGKAKNLKNRVRQYFFNSVKTDKVMAMVENVSDFSYIITKSEIDALSLENNLIKKHKPKYNILLKDDKTYPYLKVNLKEEFPTFSVTRKIKKDGAKYFGPFMGGVSVKDVLELVQTTFSIRPCNTALKAKPQKPCLNYHIKRCLAPCAGLADKEEYRVNVEKAIDFLNGNDKEPERILKEKMQLAAERQEFELAMNYRDKLRGLEKIWLKRITSLNSFLSADIFAYETDNIHSAVSVLVVRGGRMSGGKNFAVTDAAFSAGEALTEFLSRYYKQDAEIPSEIILSAETDAKLAESYFKEKFGASVSVLCPKQGVRKQLVDMAKLNAQEYLSRNIEKIRHKEDMTLAACKRLQEVLRLSRYPRRMECFDISHISGVDKVGSMTVFIDGSADKSEYRRFKIRTVEGNNDFACLKEVLRRRLAKLGTAEEERFPKPDLIIIDGGKGQLSSVKEVFDDMGIEGIDLISLAEREEEIFTLFSREAVVLPKSDYCLRMLQRIRDEAHRFAITFNRDLRNKRSLSSLLDEISGIGKEKRRALMERFKDINGILAADVEQLCTVEGIGKKRAEEIWNFFHKSVDN
ncbi:MAG: excinuclease ABC subunit C [Bacillota bacterium]|nr:MAG: excinuclease ABC subunit C [Bacillota bacterium]